MKKSVDALKSIMSDARDMSINDIAKEFGKPAKKVGNKKKPKEEGFTMLIELSNPSKSKGKRKDEDIISKILGD